VIDRFFNSKFALVGILAIYAGIGVLIALEVSK